MTIRVGHRELELVMQRQEDMHVSYATALVRRQSGRGRRACEKALGLVRDASAAAAASGASSDQAPDLPTGTRVASILLS